MNSEKIIKLYDEQSSNLDELLRTVLDKQKAVIKNQRDKLEKTSMHEESLLGRINKKEIERENCIHRVLAESGVKLNLDEQKNGAVVLPHLQKLFDEASFNELLSIREKIKSVTKQITQVNKQNLFLIEQANSIVKQMLNILLSSQTKPILDRRV